MYSGGQFFDLGMCMVVIPSQNHRSHNIFGTLGGEVRDPGVGWTSCSPNSSALLLGNRRAGSPAGADGEADSREVWHGSGWTTAVKCSGN